MQIILLEKVVNLGNLGDVVKVKEGYARNFLIPTGRAKRATAANLAEFEVRRAELERQAAEKLAESQAAAAKIEGLTVQLVPPQPLFAGALATLDVRLINARRTPRYAIGVALLDHDAWSWADVPAQGESAVQISFKPTRRGLHPTPTLTAETRYPLGTFRVWTVWRPAAQVLVYPTPEAQPPALPPGEPRSGAGLAGGARASGEFDGVRAYQRGDPMKLIVWKKFAKSDELVSRDTLHMQRQELWLDFARIGGLDVEGRLSRLAAWVLMADEQGLDYGLRLPGVEIKPASGPAQRLRCLEALATA